MSQSALAQRIKALTSELAQLQAPDADVRDALQQLQIQVQRALRQPSDESVVERLEEMAVRFETDHPSVGTALRQAIDALSKAGI